MILPASQLDRPASSASDTKLALSLRPAEGLKSPSSACCVCFPTALSAGARNNSVQLSEVYCPACADVPIDSPACLTTITKPKPPEQTRTLLNVESEIEYSKNFNKKLVLKKSPAKKKDKARAEQEEYEVACEADETGDESGVDESQVKIGIMTETDKKFMIRVNGREETPSLPSIDADESKTQKPKKPVNSLSFLTKAKQSPKKIKTRLSKFKNKETQGASNVNNNDTSGSVKLPEGTEGKLREGTEGKLQGSDGKLLEASTGKLPESSDGNNNSGDDKVDGQVKFSTLPMVNRHKHKRTIAIPQRTTSDGTQIFYICDLPKKLKKGSFRFFFIFSVLFVDFFL